ncbi:MAG: DNA primase [Firmicutes bacterium HGW-Firmicutes-16]|nr:MAG: DNA primase [Firmicutes bacterium HGW-Firmicutes-16]
MAFPENFIKELTERNDIADVVSQYVRLNKKSGNNLFGLCPFHSEKSPSFSVSNDKQIYHCFGCGKGGSVINFIMEIENLSYPDAIRFLARRVGLAVPEDEKDENYSRRERMLQLNRDAARFFYDQLSTPSGEIARQYIIKRDISNAMVTSFGLGFAPDSWDSLVSAMQKKGFTKPELLDAGLARASKKGDGGVYDTFRNRLMFPVIDIRGSVIGFSGRILDDGEPKYMNSPETLVFSKSHNLFAMNLAKKSKMGYIILSEGNIDVVAMHQAGFDCAVASLGTSLTPEQARLISRFVNEVVIIYDGDGAGIKASQRAINILRELEIRVKLVRMVGAKDPDEYIKKFGAASFANLLTGSEKDKNYMLADIAVKHDLTTDEGRIAFLNDATNFVSGFSKNVDREVYSYRLADMTNVKKETILKEVERLHSKKANKWYKNEAKEEEKPVKMNQPKTKSIHFDDVKSATAEKGVISFLYSDPSLIDKCSELDENDFSDQLLARLFTEIKKQIEKRTEPSISSLSEYFTNEEMSIFAGTLNKPLELSNGEKAMINYINIIKAQKLARLNSAGNSSILNDFASKLRESKGYGG